MGRPLFDGQKSIATLSLEALGKTHEFEDSTLHLRSADTQWERGSTFGPPIEYPEIDQALHSVLRETLENDKVLLSLAPAGIRLALAQDVAREPEETFWQLKSRLSEIRKRREQPVALRLIQGFEKRHGMTFPPELRESLERELVEDSPGHHFRYFGSTEHRSVLEALERQALSLAVNRYLLETKQRGIRLYQRFFPRFYREYAAGMSFLFPHTPNGEYKEKADYGPDIIFKLDHPYTHSNESRNGHTMFPGRMLQHKIIALMIFFHEYAHGIFDQILSRPNQGWHRHEAAYDAVNEGFATLLELLLIDKLVEACIELGLSDRDIRDLKEWKRQHLWSLKKKKDTHTWGTFYFWHKIYKRAGEEGMLRVLHHLDAKYLLSLRFDYQSHRNNLLLGEELISRY